MTVATRANIVSSFTMVKGAMISETYEVLARWDFDLSKKANLDRLRDENYIGAQSTNWLRDVGKVLNRRLDPGGRDRALVILAKGGFPIEEWKPLLLWHITRDEFLLRDFLIHWLYLAHDQGVYRVRPDDLLDYLRALPSRGGETEHVWTETTLRRVAAGLLKISADFGLLHGSSVREFGHYSLSERSLTYLIRAILQQEDGSPLRMLESVDWRMYLMREDDLRRELLRLHQFKMIHFDAAGSLIQLSLLPESPLVFAEEMVA